MLEVILNARMCQRRAAVFVLGAIALYAPLGRPAGAAPVTCAIPQPCAMYANTVGSAVAAVTTGKSGKHAAVMGTDASTNGGTNDGVLGIVGNGGWGVEGQSGTGSTGGGVAGTATTATGVFGVSQYGTGVGAVSTFGSGLNASSVLGTAINATSSNGAAISARSILGSGVVATTSSTNVKQAALMGTDTSTNGGTNDGVFGIVSNGGWGVEGQSGDGSAGGGVVGTATTATGVVGSSYNGAGIIGSSTYNNGIVGSSNVSDGVYGVSTQGSGIHGRADTSVGVEGEGNVGIAGSSRYNPIVGSNPDYGTVFEVTSNGDILYSGGLENFVYARRNMITTGYSTRSTVPNVEDVGTGNLAAGAAAIRFDSAFQAAIDAHAKYQVFLTPGGDTKGLFVSAKSPTGFMVRESQGGRDSVSFDYRIVAPALGHSSERMQLVAGTALGRPKIKVSATKFVVPKIVRIRLPLPKR